MLSLNAGIYRTVFVAFAILFINSNLVYAANEKDVEKINVTGKKLDDSIYDLTNPVSTFTDIDALSINAITIEDFLKYEPGLIVRRRYIGDPNGAIGIRGSNMFQTGRTMVFADGLPLHYHLQSRFSGAPRWSLVSANETQQVETVYGPFSAQYSGNSMGGVVNITTQFPEKFEFTATASTFLQDFELFGDDETYFGHKEFVSVGNKFGNLSAYLSHTHLENESQPQTFFNPERGTPASGTAVTGAFNSIDEAGDPTLYFGDSGSEEVTTDLTKLKLGFDLGQWFANLTLAYENRQRDADNSKTYLRDASGNPVFRGDHNFNGRLFDADGRFGNFFRVSYEERETFLIGGQLQGPVANSGWNMTLGFSVFDVIKDQRLRSDENPADPTFDASGRVREFDDTGWQTVDLKFDSERFLDRDNMRLTFGYHFDHYQLQVAEFTAVGDFRNGQKGSIRRGSPSAGETMMHAVFAEYGWEFAPMWDLVLGGRYEIWESSDGQKGTDFFADRRETEFSPKLAVGYDPNNPWSFRYSIAKAYRFPLVDELFENQDDVLGTTIANAELSPEDGLHHNFAVTYAIPNGQITMNIFHEQIEDVIFNQRDVVSNITTFLNIDEVKTTGIELVYTQKSILNMPLDVRYNVAYTDAEITENRFNPASEGKQFPRLPKWRANFLTTYHVNSQWDISSGIRLASNSFNELDNSDIAEDVFGAQDGYLFVDLKTSYQWNENFRLSAGVDNVNNDTAFVFHPWPQRTYYLEGSVKF